MKDLDINNHHYYTHVMISFRKEILCAPKEYQKNILNPKI